MDGRRLSYRLPEIVNMEPPFALLRGVGSVLAGYLDSCNPVEVAPAGLGVRTCVFERDPKRLLVGLLNNDLFAAWHGTLRLRIGEVAAVHGWWPEREFRAHAGVPLAIPAGEIVVLEIRMK